LPRGNRRPTNNARLSLTTQLMDYLESMPNPKGIPREFVIMCGFLKDEKDGFVKMFGKKVYDAHIRRYSRNRTEMAKDKLKRKKEQLRRKQEENEREDQKLRIKERELIIRQQNTQIRTEIQQSSNPTELQKAINSFNTTRSKPTKRGDLATILKLAPRLGEKKQKEHKEKGIPLLDLKITEDELRDLN